MAGPYKVILDFSCVQGSGWTEVWYYNSAVQIGAILPQVQPMGVLRAQLLGLGSLLETMTCVDTNNPRLSVTTNPLTFAPPSTYSTGTDWPSNSILLRATCGPQRGARQVWLRGIPDAWVLYSNSLPGFQPQPSMFTPLQNWINVMTGGNWCLQVDVPVATSATLSEVDSVAVSVPSGLAGLNLKPGGNFTGTVNAVIGGFKYPLQRLNGVYLYPRGYSFAANVVVLSNRSVSAAQVATYNTGGSIRNQVLTLTPITAIRYVRPGDRKVGRPIGLPRGRRSAR